MRFFKLLTVIISLAFISCKDADPRPNIILIMTDDLGWYDIGFNGNSEIQTPALDNLASQGLIFDRFYSASTVCSPTRASVLTGRHPNRLKIYGANTGHMLHEELTLPEILKEQGYSTGHFGKWHLGTFTKTEKDANRGGRPKFEEHYTIPTEHGYDSFFATESKVPTFDPMIKPDSFATNESLRYGWKAIENRSSKNYGTAYWEAEHVKATENLDGDNSKVIVDRVIPFIEKSVESQKPFFSTVWFHTPHLPVVADAEHREMFSQLDLQNQLYYGTIKAMDEQIGRLWETLEAQGIADETIIFFSSDNGPERQTPGSAEPFRGRKRDLYEGGVRVPGFVVWKNTIKAGRTSYPSVTSDYLPTILDIMNLEYTEDHPIDGISIWNDIQKKETNRNSGIGFLYGKKKSWVTDSHKLISTDGENYELYNLLEDPSETNNIIQENSEIGEQMKLDLNNWIESVSKSEQGLDY